MNNFHDSLNAYTKQNDGLQANRLLMYELGRILVKHKDDFVELLNQSGVYANAQMSDLELINKFIDSINYNKKLLIGSAFLANVHNKAVGFDGSEEISDEGVKSAYKTMYSYFDAYDYIDGDGEYSNGAGVEAIAGGVGALANLGSKVADNRHAKKYGASDLLAKKQDAKSQIIESAIKQKQTDASEKKKKEEQKKKTMKIVLISSAVVVAIIGAVVLARYIKKN